MSIDIKNAKKEFKNYVKNYNPKDPKIALKISHIERVSQKAKALAESLNLSKEDIELAELIGLLHDIGRFEQVRIYNTFMDKDSVNHAEYGVKILFQDNLIRKFIKEDTYDEIIKKAILNHNKGYVNIDKDLSERELLHAKIIRDADKLDIYYVLNNESMQVLYGDNIQNQKINKEVYREFFEDKYINYKNIHSGLDLAIAHFAYAYDFNYKYTIQKIKDDQFLTKLRSRFKIENQETKNDFDNVYNFAKKYLEKELITY